MDLCEWVSTAWSKKNNKEEKRCGKTKAGVVVKDHCQCACAEFVTEEDVNGVGVGVGVGDGDSSSCPDTEREVFPNESCANNINNDDEALKCHYNHIDSSCDQVLTCHCESIDSDGVFNNNPTWQCEELEPCPETPPPSPPPPPSSSPSSSSPTPSSSCPTGPSNLFEGDSCANIGLACNYEYTSCDQPTETCECKSNDYSGGVDNNNLRWECEQIQWEPCPETPAPVAPTLPTRTRTLRLTQTPVTRNLRG